MQLRFSQIHVTILNFVLMAVLAIASAMCVRDIIVRNVSNEPDAPVSMSVRNAVAGVRTRPYYDLFVKRDIFNETPQESVRAPVVEADLTIKLIGTSMLSKSKPYAIIEDPTGNESLYQVGEDIPDAGKLVGVETNRAIIDRGGHRVAIEIPSTDLPQVPPSQLGVPGVPAFRGPLLRGLPAAMRRKLQRLGHPGAPAADHNHTNENNYNRHASKSDK